MQFLPISFNKGKKIFWENVHCLVLILGIILYNAPDANKIQELFFWVGPILEEKPILEEAENRSDFTTTFEIAKNGVAPSFSLDEERGSSYQEVAPVNQEKHKEEEKKSVWQKIFRRKKTEKSSLASPKQSIKKNFNFCPKRITTRHVWGSQEKTCIPLATNFTTVEVFWATDYRPGHIYPFLDLIGHRFNNNTYASNIGIGGRYVPDYNSGFCEMLSFNAYYDYRQGCVGYYNQIGIGVEVLGTRWDFRGNAYVPFGKKRHIKTCVFDDYIGDFFAIRQDIESISYSFNGEVGYRIVNGANFSLYVAGGPYFLARGRCCKSTPGIEGRIRPQYRDYLTLDFSGRYDDLFGAIWQAELIVTLPLYQIQKKNSRPCGLRDWQIYQPVQRFEVMPLQKRSCWETNF